MSEAKNDESKVQAGDALHQVATLKKRHSVLLKSGMTMPDRHTDHPEFDSADMLSKKQDLHDVDFAGKRVLMRVDYNVPIKDGKVRDTARVDTTIDTIKFILDKEGVRCITLIAHLGRPLVDSDNSKYSTEPVVDVLRERLSDTGCEVKFLPDCVGDEIEAQINEANPDGKGKPVVFLCENLRFHIEETGKGEKSDGSTVKASKEDVEKFRDGLSRLGDVFVFEAFGAAHRPHSSIVGINHEQRVAGLLMGRELQFYSKVLGSPTRPFLAILGGAKVSDKIPVIENLLSLVDEMIIGGGMAYTFKKVHESMKIGSSLFDKESEEAVRSIMKKAEERGVKIHLPVDHVIANKFSADASIGVTDDAEGIEEGWMGMDVGPRTRAINAEVIGRANTVVWNGPLGVYEMGPFSAGTLDAMVALVNRTKQGATTVIGGGDTGAAAAAFVYGSKSIGERLTHVSTGGGSSLTLMEGKILPGVSMLSDKK